MMLFRLALLIGAVTAVLAQEHIVLKDGTRISGEIIRDDDDALVILDLNRRLQKFPQRIISSRNYADKTNWGAVDRLLLDGEYTAAFLRLSTDVSRDPKGGSFRQVSTLVFCLRALSQEKQLCEMAHEALRHPRRDVMRIIDLLVVPDQSEAFYDREKFWLHTIKHSRYQLARRRCAAALAMMYALRGERAKGKRLAEKYKLKNEKDLAELLRCLDAAVDLDGEGDASIRHLDMYQGMYVRALLDNKRYDEAALHALRFGLDPKRDAYKRTCFLQLAESALQVTHPQDAKRVKDIYQKLQAR